MLKALKFITAPVRCPLKIGGVALAALIGAVALGDQVESWRTAAMDLVGATADNTDLVTNVSGPVEEIEFLRTLDQEVKPDLSRARSLILARRADIEYSRELSGFLEKRISPDEMSLLRRAVVDGADGEIAKSVSAPGQSWLSYQRKIRALEGDLERLLVVNEHVATLYERLGQRRNATLGLLPDSSPRDPGTSQAPTAPEIDEAQRLLSSIHERLFKGLFSLSPELVKGPAHPATAAQGATAMSTP